MNPFSKSKVDIDIALRGFAISWVVLNHAAAIPGRGFELGGGMNILLLLAGAAFARFTLTRESASAIRQSVLRFTVKLVLPCFAIVALSFVAYREFSLPELLFFSNWISIEHIAPMYTWYPQVIAQIMLLLLLITFIPGLVSLLRTRPVAFSCLALLVSIIIFLIFDSVWDGQFGRRLPHFSLWNFVFGWVVVFVGRAQPRIGTAPRLALVLIAGALAAMAYDVEEDWLRVVAMSGGVAALLLVKRVSLPKFAARIATVLSQATFTIFLFHVFFLRAFDAFGLRKFSEGFYLPDVLQAWTFTMVGTIGIWIGLTSVSRAFRHFMTTPISDDRIASSTSLRTGMSH